MQRARLRRLLQESNEQREQVRQALGNGGLSTDARIALSKLAESLELTIEQAQRRLRATYEVRLLPQF